MKKLFQEFLQSNNEIIQNEIYQYFLQINKNSNKDSNKKRIKTYAISVPTDEILSQCPNFSSVLHSHLKIEMIDLFRYYVTPAESKMGIHIDGTDPKVPFGLNFPVYNSTNNYMYWYDISDSDMHLFNAHKKYGYMSSYIPKKGANLKIIECKNIDKPYFVKTDIMHNVVNNTNEDRIILSVRFLLDRAIQNPNEILL